MPSVPHAPVAAQPSHLIRRLSVLRSRGRDCLAHPVAFGCALAAATLASTGAVSLADEVLDAHADAFALVPREADDLRDVAYLAARVFPVSR
jgi:hypothetical protein